MWERFFNWQSDMDWTWGPFLPLRPARTQPMQPWVWVRLFTALSLAGLLLVLLIRGVCVLGPRLAARQDWSFSPSVQETLGTLAAMGNDPNARLLLIGMVFSLPLLFFAFSLPFHVAWNRRATRLSAEKPDQEEPDQEEPDQEEPDQEEPAQEEPGQGGSWPPAPRRV